MHPVFLKVTGMPVDPPADSAPIRIPLVEERLNVAKEIVETGRVVVSATISTDERVVEDTLSRTTVRVERVPVDRIVDTVPVVRTEGDRMITPVVEEIFVKRFRIIEEVHLITERSSEPFAQRVTLRRRDVDVQRSDPGEVRRDG